MTKNLCIYLIFLINHDIKFDKTYFKPLFSIKNDLAFYKYPSLFNNETEIKNNCKKAK